MAMLVISRGYIYITIHHLLPPNPGETREKIMGSGAPAAFFPLKIQADLRGTTKKKENKFGSSPHFYIGKSPECLKPPGF